MDQYFYARVYYSPNAAPGARPRQPRAVTGITPAAFARRSYASEVRRWRRMGYTVRLGERSGQAVVLRRGTTTAASYDDVQGWIDLQPV